MRGINRSYVRKPQALKIVFSILTLLAGFPGDASARSADFGGLQGKAILPTGFVANSGELDSKVLFSLRSDDVSVLIGKTEIWLLPVAGGSVGGPVRMRFVGSEPEPEVTGIDRLPGVVNSYFGNDPKRWHAGVATWSAVARNHLYPGIDQILRVSSEGLKSEFRVAPGADAGRIRMLYPDAGELEISDLGELVVRTPTGEWRESAPVIYQEIESRRVEVPGRFELLDDRQVGFFIDPHDPAYELVIDPVISFSTFLGGDGTDAAGYDAGRSIAIDEEGNVLVCGVTRSLAFPVTDGSIKAGPSDDSNDALDFFVSKLAPDGTGPIYSTYLGGEAREFSCDIAVDPEGNAYATGGSTSFGFPTFPGCVVGPTPFGVGGAGSTVEDAVVFKLGPSGSLIYSTYLGGSTDDQPNDIAVDEEGNAYIVGETASSDFHTTAGAYQTALAGSWDVFITKLEPTCGNYVFSTFLGDTEFEIGRAVALDTSNNVYILGSTQSPNFPVAGSPPYDGSYNGTDSVFLTKLSSNGTAPLVYSTFLELISPPVLIGFDVAVDSAGNAHAAFAVGETPFMANGWDPTFNGAVDAILMKLDPFGSTLLGSTFLGGGEVDRPFGIALESNGNVLVTGLTTSADYPVVDPLAGQATLGGIQDGFITRLEPGLQSLDFSSFLGGSEPDHSNSVAVATNRFCLTGQTTSEVDFPIAGIPPLQPIFGGGSADAFVFCADDLPVPFACDNVPYIGHSRTGQLSQVILAPTSFSFASVGPASGVRYNSMGFRKTDGLIYAVDRNAGSPQIIQIDSLGMVYPLGTPSGLPLSLGYIAGDVHPNGTPMYIVGPGGSTLYSLPLPAVPIPPLPPVTSQSIIGDSGRVADWALNPCDDKLYGGDSVGDGVHGEIAMLDPATGMRSDTLVPGLPVGRAFGAAWFNPAGTLFLSRNNGEIYEVNLAGPTIVSTRLGPQAGPSDGAACIPDGCRACSTVSGTVWEDLDCDGIRDPGEPGIANVEVTITDSQGNVQTLFTDADGHYTSDCLPSGETLVEVTPPPGNQTADPDGVLDNQTNVFLPFGQNVTGVDFGYGEEDCVPCNGCGPCGGGGPPIFTDCFESGNTSAWPRTSLP